MLPIGTELHLNRRLREVHVLDWWGKSQEERQKRNRFEHAYWLLINHPEVDMDEINKLAECLPHLDWKAIFEIDRWISDNVSLFDGSVGLETVSS
jgi:hypothetical protein